MTDDGGYGCSQEDYLMHQMEWVSVSKCVQIGMEMYCICNWLAVLAEVVFAFGFAFLL
jgi:hypothetical protein